MLQLPNAALRVLQADNPWLTDRASTAATRFVPAGYVARDVRLVADQRVCLVVGPRQAGKSTLIWKTLLDRDQPFLYVNCEELALRESLTSPALFAQALDELVSAGAAVFFEEVQRLPEAGLFLKGLVDRHTGHPFFAAGSSSFDLEAQTRESLAGRAQRHLLLPFSLAELAPTLPGPPALREQSLDELSEKLMRFGGYPSVFKSDNPEATLTGLVESFVIRDASDRFHVRNPAAFRKVLELAASQIGNLCNYSEWAAVAGIAVETAREYASLLSDTHVIRLVKPFVGGKRAEITSTPKVFFLDNGVRNRLFGGFAAPELRPDRGALAENFVFGEICKSLGPVLDDVRYWRSKSGAEVDFVIERQGRIDAVEVKAGDSRGRLDRSAMSFIEAYAPQRFFIVNSQEHPDTKVGKTHVRYLKPHQIFKAIAEA
jgi:predicted AAA+ superfamily ATPase